MTTTLPYSVLTALAIGCVQTPPTWEPGWQPGDVHVHSSVGSNDADGDGTPDRLAAAMVDAGLSWAFITDHSNSQGSMACPTGDVEDCPNQGPELPVADWPANVWPASEISPVSKIPSFGGAPRGHVGCLPLDGASFTGLDAFIDRPTGEVTGGEALEQCTRHGGFAILNHPFGPTTWVAFDWTSEAFDAIEVYNGGGRFNPFDAAAVEAWATRVAEGRDVVPVGGSDCHRWSTAPPGTLLDPALGWPTTSVRLRADERPVDALRRGAVKIHEPGTELELYAWAGRATVGPGESLAGPVVAEVRATSAAAGMVVQLVDVIDGVLDEAPVGTSTTSLTMTLPAGHTVYARVWPASGVTEPTAGVALTNAIRVR